MRHPEDIVKHSYSFEYIDPFHTTAIRILLPELRKLKCEVRGDWAPNYCYELSEDTGIGISYNQISGRLAQKVLQFEAPMSAAIRENLPFAFIIEDPDRGIDMQLYLDKKGELARAKVMRKMDQVLLYEKYFDNQC